MYLFEIFLIFCDFYTQKQPNNINSIYIQIMGFIGMTTEYMYSDNYIKR